MIRGVIIVLGVLFTHHAVAQGLMVPVEATCISSPFGPRTIPGHPEAGTFHYGLDFPAPYGAPVLATEAGTVVRVQDHGVGGLEVLIQHTGGFVGVYSHLASVSNRIAARTPVVQGELVGYVGHTGLTFGPHLYFGVLRDGVPIDPAPMFELPRCSGRSPVRTPAQILAAGGKLPPTRSYGVPRIAAK
jgi:murein DD-endopeptidase MepM/ murein hydrolase activator NlpD